MVIPTEHFRSEYSNIPLRIAKGHFATGHSHINYYIDMTYTKYRLAEARQAARELAVKYRTVGDLVDTILCVDGTEVLGALLAEELTKVGIRNRNEHDTLYVVTPEQNAGQYIFRENTAHLIQNRHVVVLAASVTSGGTVQGALEAVRYYGGTPVGICCIFSCLEQCQDLPVTTIFESEVLGDYKSLPANQCPLCKAGVKLDALVNSYGISSFYK